MEKCAVLAAGTDYARPEAAPSMCGRDVGSASIASMGARMRCITADYSGFGAADGRCQINSGRRRTSRGLRRSENETATESPVVKCVSLCEHRASVVPPELE